ncbi:nitrite reductase/ring-hydroxylating ferredoxin subunit [Nocardioides aromaticivorans]|uniref:Nitrite reductase/ring-hydroxylating ferredoxin subunit n=2 Tax=Nocardioides TaxID=1839 RepID=A0A7Y9ZMV6_9ACTN|nr:non-heme iron oxygenase ferredoxin subunit [Nocardioides aromaticivorans]NYI47780.1 nitrite reductase/ring-hydroxylating ferredoxin subunit [Nocardioides aromaticivorans]BAG06225.1 dibenzofuran 4,4a-dioxygenase ferredoxin [Nocardioides sp. DF412]
MTNNDVEVELPNVEGRTWRRACAAHDVPEDEGLCVGTLPPVSVFVTEGEYFCIDDTCTHETYSLADGWVADGFVECALHLAKFNLRTGEPLAPPATTAVAVHPVALVDGVLYVALPSAYLIKE